MRNTKRAILCLIVYITTVTAVGAADRSLGSTSVPLDTSLFQAMEWRNIGPFRGGRSTAVAGIPSSHSTYYFGSTGGGVWRTDDGGIIWRNVSDGFFNTGSVGAIAVAESDPNVVYVGMGEACFRGVMSSHGDGVYKSYDGGDTWIHLGLEMTRQISTVVVHPKNPQLVYVAAQGNPWIPTGERGIYRSVDGGKNWDLVLHVDRNSGASNLSMDRTNPRILYAAFWDHQRTPWKIRSGGPGSGIWKSTDGGDTWKKLEAGLPDLMGKTAVTVSPASPKRVWVLAEAEEGGLYRSDDGGKTFKLVNRERVLRARSWYYIHVFADPQDENVVYVLNAPMMKSTDGGKTFQRVSTPHGDNHALWINPDNSRIMINGNDGGANVSYNGGITWSTQRNQPTAQFYRVTTDNRFPYYIYGGQQDNSSLAIASRTSGWNIGWKDWYSVAGCESAYLAFNRDNPTLIYGGCYQGIIEELNIEADHGRSVMAYEFFGLGSDPIDQKYRFNWNAPIIASPRDPTTIYHAGNVLLKTEDRGETWQVISPDLTRNKKENLGKGGGPITNEAAGGEIYHTIMYVEVSPHEEGVIWVGSDDGLIHVTKDEGENWQDVTPGALKEGMVNSIDISPHDPATAYIAFTRYKFGDFTPHIYKTFNYGKTWNRISRGIPEEAFVRVVREDPGRRGLLYAGTETGLYISLDDGKHWQSFQRNLPVTPITDLIIHNNDLIAATQGRAFWILDDLTPLHQMSDEVLSADIWLLSPRSAYRMDGGSGNSATAGKNPPNGLLIYYTLTSEPDSGATLKLEISDSDGELIRTISTESGPAFETWRGRLKPPVLTTEKGLNKVIWDLRHESIETVPGLRMEGPPLGYRVAPGEFTATLSLGDKSMSVTFEVINDPRRYASEQSYRRQQQIAAELHHAANDIHKSVKRARSVKDQINGILKVTESIPDTDTLQESGQAIVEAIDVWEAEVVQTKQETRQDVVNFSSKLNAHILALLSTIDSSDPPVTDGARDRYGDLMAEWDERQDEFERIVTDEVETFNKLYRELEIPAIVIEKN